MTVPLEQAQARLAELIAKSAQGESVVITGDGNKPVARIVAVPPSAGTPQFGFAKDWLKIVEDDDEHLNDFKEYMPK
ncbi:MAG TPA: type II toxin-antitoxin system prevent-host-death family antitoxin [Phycisphaerales bacterium]|nr:type II toxin-antitoxin system prevent-host-death family antitoxin [Phycisphaerales bacterium]